MKDAFFSYNTDFFLFGFQHITVLLSMVGLCISFPWVMRRYSSYQAQVWLSRAMAILLAFAVLFWIGTRLALGDFDYTTDLPLDICNIVALSLPWLMWHPRRDVHEVLYFWILAGTLQAVLTPHLYDAYPAFTFWKYWIVHAGLIVYTIYITATFGFYPSKKGLWRSFLYLQGYALVIFLVNWLIGANYLYLLRKPPTASALDFLGPWPWYLLVVEVIGLLLFHLFYLPVRRRTKRMPLEEQQLPQ